MEILQTLFNDVFRQVFGAVATLLAIGMLGFWVISRRILPEQVLRSLSVLALDVALPCLIFANILKQFTPETQDAWWVLPLWWGGFTLFALAMSLGCMWFVRREWRREFAAGTFYQNAIFFPLAILVAMDGRTSPIVLKLFLFTMFFSAMFFSTYPFFFAREGTRVPWRKVFNPVFVITVLAVALCLLGWQKAVPRFVTSSADLVGGMAVPLLMLVLGGNIFVDFRQRGRVHWLAMGKFVLTKNILFPLVTLGLLMLIRPDADIALLLMLQAVIPPITSVPVVAQREGGNRSIASQFLLASFLASLVTMPLALMVFRNVFPG